jgi:hypothetical protein
MAASVIDRDAMGVRPIGGVVRYEDAHQSSDDRYWEYELLLRDLKELGG